MNIAIIDCFDTWEHRVDLLYKVMTEAGHKVSVLLSDYRHIDKVRRIEEKPGCRFFTAEPYVKNLSIARLHSHMQLSRDIFDYVEKRRGRIDLLWVLAPPNSFVYSAAQVKRRNPRVRLVIDLIDLWPETMPVGGLKKMPVFKIWKSLRDANLQYVDLVVTECDLYRKALGGAIEGIQTETLYLAREDGGYAPCLALPGDKLSLCYLGSINHVIDIEAIGEIIRQCRKRQYVVLHIVGDGERKDELVDAGKKAGAEVIYHGKIYDRTGKQTIFDMCHYGLNVMKKSVCVGLTMKSIDYFEFGLPVINNIRGDTWEAVERYDVGVNWKDAGSVSAINMKTDDRRHNARNFYETFLSEKAFSDILLNKILVRMTEKAEA